MDNPALLSELVARAAKEHAAMVEPAGRTDTPDTSEHGGKLATLLYLAGLGSDVATTAYGAHTGRTTEANPLVKWAGPKGAAPLVAGAGILNLLLARKLLKNHPKLRDGLLMGGAAAHGAAAASNMHQMHSGASDQTGMMPSTTSTPPRPGMVQAPDGSWYDPSLLTVK